MLKQVQHDKGKNFSRTWCKAPIVSAKVPVYRQHQFNPQPKVVENNALFLFFCFVFFSLIAKRKENERLFVIKNFLILFFNNVLFFFLFAIKEIRKVPKE